MGSAARILTWIVKVAFVTCIALVAACGAKQGGDGDLIPGRLPVDAGNLSQYEGGKADAYAEGGAFDAGRPIIMDAAVTVDAAPPTVVDASKPKPTLSSISVSPSDTNLALTGKVTLKVTGMYSDGSSADVTGAATFTSSDTKVALVNGSTVTGVSPGKATIVATVNGALAFANVTVGPATVVSISVSPSFSTIYTEYGYTVSLVVEATMSDGSQHDVTDQVTWTSSSSATAYVSPDGHVQGLSQGSVKITATLGQVQGTATVQVNGPTAKHLTVSASPPVASVGDFVTGIVEASFDSGMYTLTGATWESSNPSVLKMSGTGAGIALSPGKAVLTAMLGDLPAGTVEVTVTAAHLDHLEISPAMLALDYPKQGHMTLYGVYSDQTKYDFTALGMWSVDDYSVVGTTNTPGDFVPSGLGSTPVHASYDNLGADATITVGAGNPVSLDIGSDPLTVPNYTTFIVAATLVYADGSVLDASSQATWTTDDSNIATLLASPDQPGRFVAAQPGSTKIRAKVGNLTSSDRQVIVSSLALLSIDLSDNHFYLTVGQDYDLNATGTFADGSQEDISYSVVWKTGNTGVATVSNATSTIGRVTGVAAGTTSVSATLGMISATTTVTIN
jgi:hypothetical protein